MISGSYYTNLMSNDFTYPGDYATRQPDDTPVSNELPAQDDPHGAVKEKKRSKSFNVDEDKLLVSAWLNVLQDPI
jgi:hypothetical protein